jgi:hypothetical protein
MPRRWSDATSFRDCQLLNESRRLTLARAWPRACFNLLRHLQRLPRRVTNLACDSSNQTVRILVLTVLHKPSFHTLQNKRKHLRPQPEFLHTTWLTKFQKVLLHDTPPSPKSINCPRASAQCFQRIFTFGCIISWSNMMAKRT